MMRYKIHDMKELPPFYVGQRVVAISNHEQSAFRKHNLFYVTSIKKGRCKCAEWIITIGILTPFPFGRCNNCDIIWGSEPEWEFASSRFAPADQMQIVTYSKMLEEVPMCVN